MSGSTLPFLCCSGHWLEQESAATSSLIIHSRTTSQFFFSHKWLGVMRRELTFLFICIPATRGNKAMKHLKLGSGRKSPLEKHLPITCFLYALPAEPTPSRSKSHRKNWNKPWTLPGYWEVIVTGISSHRFCWDLCILGILLVAICPLILGVSMWALNMT